MIKVIPVYLLLICILLPACSNHSGELSLKDDLENTSESVDCTAVEFIAGCDDLVTNDEWYLQIDADKKQILLLHDGKKAYVYEYGPDTAIPYFPNNKIAPRIVFDNTVNFALFIYPREIFVNGYIEGAVLFDLSDGNILYTYNNITSDLLLDEFKRTESDIAEIIANESYTISCDMNNSSSEDFYVTFTLRTENYPLVITANYHQQQLYADRILHGEEVLQFITSYDSLTQIFEWFYWGMDRIQCNTELQYRMGNVWYYLIEDKKFDLLEINSLETLKAYMGEYLTDTYIEELISENMFIEIDDHLYLNGVGRAHNNYFREPEYSIRTVNDYAKELICHVNYYPLGAVEPLRVEELSYRFELKDNKWLCSSYPEFLEN